MFVLGAMSARFFMKVHHMPMPHVDFDDNGCVVVDSIKCPKMLEKLQSADMDSDGCITKQEFKKSMFKKHKMKRNMHHDAETPDVENHIVVETESGQCVIYAVMIKPKLNILSALIIPRSISFPFTIKVNFEKENGVFSINDDLLIGIYDYKSLTGILIFPRLWSK